MKKVFLIGDSIRMGYDKYVEFALKDVCEVKYPKYNCMYALHVLRNLGDWKREYGLCDDTDVIHWNAGLWDSLTLYNDGCLTPLEHYENYIERICKRIKLLFPAAKVIFATSTPVLEHRFLTPEEVMRYNDDIKRYNAAAVKIVKEYGFYVNDLYSVIENVPESYYSDMTHLYTAEGTELLTNAVIKAIGTALGTEYGKFTVNDYKQVKEVIGL